MDVQTVLMWAARLACPLALGVMVWLLLRQSRATADQAPAQPAATLEERRAVLDAEIVALEAHAVASARIDSTQPVEVEVPTG